MYQRIPKVIGLNGVNYKIPSPKTRPTIKALKKKGFVARIDFESKFKWIELFVEKWSKNPLVQKATEDAIAGMVISLEIGDIIVSVERLSPKSKQAYLLECYNTEEFNPELRFIVDISGSKALYRIVDYDETSIFVNQSHIDIATATISEVLMATKLYTNLTKYRIFDKDTMLEGTREINIEPIIVFGKDVLLDSAN